MGYCVETRDELINSPQIRGENKNLCPIRAQKEGKAMKRSFAMALALALVFTLSACGAPAETEEQVAARELDSQVWAVVTTAGDQLQALDDVVADAADRGDTDVLGVMIAVLQSNQDSLDNFDASTQSAMLYVGAARAYTANARVICEAIRDYLDGGDADDYAKFEKYWGMVSDLTDNAVEKRKSFLADVGFSESEIADFPAEVRDS